MRLVDAILERNSRRLNGEPDIALAPDVAGSLPVAILTCIDSRLNQRIPEALGVPSEQMIWLRNAGNIITSPISSTTRSLALACVVKGAKEIAIIGHTDCQVGRMTMLQLLERFAAIGVDRQRLPENLVDYFGLFASERQNVIRSAEIVRSSPLIGSRIPVHGLMLDVTTGRLERVVNGYDAPPPAATSELRKIEASVEAVKNASVTAAEQFHLPTAKIGEIASFAQDWLHRADTLAQAMASPVAGSGAGPTPSGKPAASPTAAPPATGSEARTRGRQPPIMTRR